MKMTLTQLRYLVAIADANLNITLAAGRMHATQPGLSKQLKQLEEEFGVLLFGRKGRSLNSVTATGEEVIRRARCILAEVENIQRYVGNLRCENPGRLIVTTTHTQAKFVLPPVVARIQQIYPHVSVHLQHAAEGAALDLLSQGETDIAVVSSAVTPPLAGIAVPLFRWRRLIIVPRGHALDRSNRQPDIQALAVFPLISYDSSVRPESSLQRAFSQASLTPRLALTALDADLIKTYVRTGLGVGILAEMALTTADADLRVWPMPPSFCECIAWAVLPRDRVVRNYAVEMIHGLAPQIDREDLRRILSGHQTAHWPEPPQWAEGNMPALP